MKTNGTECPCLLVPENKWNRKQEGHLKQQNLEGAQQHA